MSQFEPLTVTVRKLGKGYEVTDQLGNLVDLNKVSIPDWMLKKAVKENKLLRECFTKSGDTQWRRVGGASATKPVKPSKSGISELTGTDVDLSKPFDGAELKSSKLPEKTESPANDDIVVESSVYTETPKSHEDLISFVHDSYRLKPKGLVMNEVQWKMLVRSALRGKNIMLTGDSGFGKTLAAKALGASLKRQTEVFNIGACQDAKSYLIGNTHYNKETGTFFAESKFVSMLKTPNSVIILDEFTRGTHDAWNILMPVLDPNQRYLRLDEKVDSEVVRVAEGVCFIATANIGNQYTATRVLDQAASERFLIVEMQPLAKADEMSLVKYLYPNVKDIYIDAITSIAEATRNEILVDAPKIDRAISTRLVVEMASLMNDGFKLTEAAEVAIFPHYEKQGGADAERTFVKQTVQAFIPVEDQTDGAVKSSSDSKLFDDTEIESAPNS